jgi:hypothetical protein
MRRGLIRLLYSEAPVQAPLLLVALPVHCGGDEPWGAGDCMGP